MPKVSELKDSKYIKKEDCPLSLTISHVEQENMAMEGEGEDLRWVLHFEETPKGLVMNITNGEIMAENFGDDEMNNWRGRRVDLYNDRNVVYRGKRTGGVRVKSIEPSTESVNKDMQEAKNLNEEEETGDEEIPF